MGMAMRALVLDAGFGLENLQIAERPVPEPGPGEVRVRMQAVSLNYRDWLLVAGSYNPRQTFPVVPASDGAGIVDAVGPGVENFQPGDRVVNQFVEAWKSGPARPGAISESRGGPGGVCASRCGRGADGAATERRRATQRDDRVTRTRFCICK